MIQVLCAVVGFGVIGSLVIWNICLSVENQTLVGRNKELIDNVAQLVSEQRARDSHGRFVRKS